MKRQLIVRHSLGGFPKIADAKNIVDTMLRQHSHKDAVTKTVDVLREMNQRHVAKKLEQDIIRYNNGVHVTFTCFTKVQPVCPDLKLHHHRPSEPTKAPGAF